MAAPWESDPVVEAPRAPAAAGLRRGAPTAPWEADAPTPTVESSLPNIAPGGLTPPGRRGAAAVPTAAEVAGAPPPEIAPQVPAPEPTIKDKVVGAVEAGIEMLAQLTGGSAGIVTGGLAGIGRAVGAGQFGTPEGAQAAQESAAAGGQAGAGMVRQGLRMNPLTGPAVMALERTGGGLGPAMSPVGQENVEAIGGVINQLPAFQPAIGPAGAMASGLSIPGAPAAGLRRSIDAITQTVRRTPIEEPPAGSVGAAGTKKPTERAERAAALPVPIDLTKGQRERTFEQQRFEREAAKDPEVGKPLRDRFAEQNERVLKNFDEFVDQTGAAETDSRTVGKAVVDPIIAKASKAKDEVRAAYKKAEEAGETAEPVSYQGVRDYIEEQTPTTREKLAPVLKMAEEQLAKNDPDGSGVVPLKALEDVRKAIRANIEFGTPNEKHGGELITRIDAAMDAGGGQLFKEARRLHRTYASEFKNQGVIRDLIGFKKGTSDRKVALADVFERSVLNAPLEDVRNVKRTLTTAGEKGVQAWNDLRGKTIDWIKEQATSNSARDERGNPIVSAPKLDRAIKKLDEDGRLEELFGKQGAQQLRDVNDLAKDIYTAPPGAVNTSGTASVLLGALDTLVTYMASGGTVPLPAFTILKKGLQNLKERKLKAKVRYALGPGEPIKGSTVRAFEPEPPDAGGTPPAPKPPGNVPPTGGQAALPGVEPAPGTVPRGTGRQATKRERELVTLRDQVTDPQVRKDLDLEIAAERRRTADQNRAAEYRAIAQATTDPALRAKFEERAAKLEPANKPEPEPEPIPVGEAVELEVQDATLDMVKATAEAETAWRREHRLGDLDAERAKTTAQALQYDAPAVERAAQQFENSPRAFDREVQRIIDEGKARETQGEQGVGGGEALGRPAEAGGGQAGARVQQAGPDGAAAAGAKRQGSAGQGGAAGPLTPVADLFRDNKGMKRADMPVIPNELKPQFTRELEAAGVKVKPEQVQADSLKPTQADYNLENIEFLRGEVLGGKYAGNPIVVSRDGRVLDGHHRWVVAAQHRLPIDVLRVDLPIEQLLGKAKDFQRRKGVASRSAGEASAKKAAAEPDAVVRATKYLDERADVPPDLRAGIIERYREAERAMPAYQRALRAAGAALGARAREVIVAPIKVPSRATEKILVDYQGDARRIKDLVRGTIVIADVGAANDTIAALRKQFGNLLDLRNALDEGSPPVSPDGYRDMKMNVLVDGHLAEVQISVPEMIAAKKEAHPLYERVEALNRAAEKEGRDLTPDEAREKFALQARQQAIYGSAWEAATRRRNSPSDTLRPLRSNEGSGNRRSGDESQARSTYSADRVTGTPSTSKNSVPAGKERGSGMAAPPPPILNASAVGRQTIATTERGVEIPVRYRVVDVADLITSHDNDLRVDPRFPAELQPRDRTRASSEAQITRIANDIKPEFLAESPKASDGAPIIGADAVVESGNARTIALRRAYAGGKADHYRAWLAENAGRFGLSRADVEGIRQPMLVREGVGNYDRAEFARQANESAVSSMSTTEQAKADAARLPDLEGLATSDDGQINSRDSAEFIRQFMRYVAAPTEHNRLMTTDGRLSQDGANRIRNAVFFKAYDDAEIVSMLTEATDANVRNLLAGMLRAAPAVARLRGLLEAGARAGRDFAPDLVDAVRRFGAAREAGQKVEQYLAQGAMFGGEASPEVAALMRSLEKDARAPTRIADMIRRMVDEIDSGGDPRQPTMF